MRAILNSKHQLFCNWLQDVRKKLGRDNDPKLDELEKTLLHFYNAYQGKNEEVKRVINEYERAQKEIRNRIKRMQRKDFIAENGSAEELISSETVDAQP